MEPLSGEPMTRARLAADLNRLGLRAGDVVLVHSSLKSLGWVCGGAVAVVQALLDVLGPGGTLMAPAHSGENSDPSLWENPPVPESWWPVIREHTPAFDPAVTPSDRVGIIPEMIRTWPGAVRSDHPQSSFAAIGPAAADLTAGHRLDDQLGESSPLAALERLDGKVLLLGVGFDSCTTFHLAEYRIPHRPLLRQAAAVNTPEGRRWLTYTDVRVQSEDFDVLGAAYEQAHPVLTGQVGEATCRLFPARSAVEFAIGWLQEHRPTPDPEAGPTPASGAEGRSVALGG